MSQLTLTLDSLVYRSDVLLWIGEWCCAQRLCVKCVVLWSGKSECAQDLCMKRMWSSVVVMCVNWENPMCTGKFCGIGGCCVL